MDPTPLDRRAFEALLAWFTQSARVYPWSTTRDPYAVWISETMLQQTVVTAAVEPYRRWLDRWPHLAALAAADEAEVLRAWEGLGYASRARNLHRAAQRQVAAGASNLPDDEEALRALPGIGPYTAAAIASFAFGRPALTLDANLKRVFQRLDAEPHWTAEVEARWRRHWATLVGAGEGRAGNQALMQLGQLVCRPRAPRCEACPLAGGCQARALGRAEAIPVRQARVVTRLETQVVFYHRPGQWWLAHPRRGRFSNLWLVAPAAPSAAARSLGTEVHTYTRYRDHLEAWVEAWGAEGDPPLPEGWTGAWFTAEEAEDQGMVSTYRRLWRRGLDLTKTS